MGKHFSYLVIGISILLLAACSAAQVQRPIHQGVVTPSITSAQASPTITIQPIPVSRPTGTSSPGSTSTPEISAVRQCLTIEDYITGQTSMEGLLLLIDTNTYDREFAYDLKQGVYRSTPLGPTKGRNASLYWGYHAISPNGNWIAFIENEVNAAGKTTGRYLAVADVNGKKLDIPSWSFVNVQWLMGWINNEQIALWVPDKPYGTIVSLNPFSGKVDSLPPPASLMVDTNSSLYLDIFYNPALTHILYVKGSKSNELKYALMDRSVQRDVWEGEFHESIPPKWAPDGQSFAIFGPDPGFDQSTTAAEQLFQVTVDGQALPLTPSQPTTDFEHWSWSPDSRSIAVWLVPQDDLQLDQPHLRSLNLIDVGNHSSIDFCLQSEDEHWKTGPVWSPDSQYIAIPLVDRQETRNGGFLTPVWKTILVDIKNNKAYKLIEDAAPVGWMAEQ